MSDDENNRIAEAYNDNQPIMVDDTGARAKITQAISKRVLGKMRTPLLEQAAKKVSAGGDSDPEHTIFNGIWLAALHHYQKNGDMLATMRRYTIGDNPNTAEDRRIQNTVLYVAETLKQPVIIGLEKDIHPDIAYRQKGSPWVDHISFVEMTMREFLQRYPCGKVAGYLCRKRGEIVNPVAKARAEWKATSDTISLGFIIGAALQKGALKLPNQIKEDLQEAVGVVAGAQQEYQKVLKHFNRIFDQYHRATNKGNVEAEPGIFFDEKFRYDSASMLGALRWETGNQLGILEANPNLSPTECLYPGRDYNPLP